MRAFPWDWIRPVRDISTVSPKPLETRQEGGRDWKWLKFKMENIIRVSRGDPHNCNIFQLVKTNPVLANPKQSSWGKKRSLNEDQNKENKKVETENICNLCLQKIRQVVAFLTNVRKLPEKVTW